VFTGDKNKSTPESVPASMAGHAEAKETDMEEYVLQWSGALVVAVCPVRT